MSTSEPGETTLLRVLLEAQNQANTLSEEVVQIAYALHERLVAEMRVHYEDPTGHFHEECERTD